MVKWFSARILLAGFIALLATLLVVLVVGNVRREKTRPVLEVVRSDSDLAMQKINYTETQDGRRKWSIQADSAAHDFNERYATIENIRMVIYEQQGGDIVVSARQGRFDMDKGLVTLQGDVRLADESGQSIYTDRLEFDDPGNVLRSEESVRIVSNGMALTGVGLRYDLRRNIFRLLDSVQARFAGESVRLP